MTQQPFVHTEQALLGYLAEKGIHYTRVEHPAVFTCEEAARYRPKVDGLDTKNLFLRDEKGQFYLVVTACEKRLDIKGVGRLIGAPKLHFGSEAQLLDCLGLTPGSVTILGLVNDHECKVHLVADAAYWPSPAYLCHPLVNTATLVLDHTALQAFLASTGHTVRVTEMAERA